MSDDTCGKNNCCKRQKALEELAKLEEAQVAADASNKTGWPGDIEINGYTLKMTCAVCPEQYDVFNANGVQVGYLRLRGGFFRADCPDVGGDTVYQAHTKGDGCFEDDERIPQLTAAVNSIAAYWERTMENTR